MMANNTLSDHLAIANAVAGMLQLLLVLRSGPDFQLITVDSQPFLQSSASKFLIKLIQMVGSGHFS
jgi:hypothetical protein